MTFNNTKFYVLPRLFGSARISKDFPLKLKDDELLRLTNIMPYIPNILQKYFPNQEIIIHFLIELKTGLDFNTYRNSGLNVLQCKQNVSKITFPPDFNHWIIFLYNSFLMGVGKCV